MPLEKVTEISPHLRPLTTLDTVETDESIQSVIELKRSGVNPCEECKLREFEDRAAASGSLISAEEITGLCGVAKVLRKKVQASFQNRNRIDWEDELDRLSRQHKVDVNLIKGSAQTAFFACYNENCK